MANKLHKDTELQKIFIKEGVLYRLWIEDGRTFKCILVPQVLQDFVIILAHDYSGHNGSRRTYNCLKRQYYWPGIRKQIFRHCKKCKECVLQNQGQPEKCFGHFDLPDLPMEFICMDLVGPIHPPSSRGNKYVLTVIDMLTGFTIAAPIKNKNAETICDAYCPRLLPLLPMASWKVRAFSLCLVFTSSQLPRVVPHGTKGTGPEFVTRPVYSRS